MSHYKNRKSIRLKNWDYSSNGLYFITICTKNREHHFGKIVDGEMFYSDIGKIAEQYWYEITEHFDFVVLHACVVMPNHIHGIIEICKVGKTAMPFSREGSISSIIGSYKSIVTKKSRIIDRSFGWQSRFHDHIIRNENAYIKISEYVKNNPKTWEDDMLHS